MTSITRLSLKNRLLVALITGAVALFGFISMNALKQELMPSMQVPMAFVTADSQGLAPDEMSRNVTEPIEQALKSIPALKNITSTTSSGNAQIQASWDFKADDDETIRLIKNAVDSVKSALPANTQAQVFSGGLDSLPSMIVSAGSENNDEKFADSLAQRAVPAIQGVAGVQKVQLTGREEQRIAIDLRSADVTRLKIEPSSISAVLQAYGASVPAGDAATEDGSGRVSVSVGNGVSSIEELQALPFTDADGNVVRLSDFADVKLESVPLTSISRVNGKPALMLQVSPAQGANVVDISHGVKKELDTLAPELKAEFVTVFDQAPYIEQSVHDLTVEGGLGLLFAVLVILAFLGSWRSTVIAAVSIPLSLLITLIGLLWSGNTLNMLTLGALTIAVGRVVDDSIVVIENISRRRGPGELTVEGVVASVRQVAGAITASTLTTVAVFAPIAFVSGVAGQLFRPFAITVSIALLASLVVALTVVPVLAFWFMRNRPAKSHGAEIDGARDHDSDHHDDLAEIHTAPDRLQRAVMPRLTKTRRHPIITVSVAVGILVATLAMASFIRTDFLGSSGAETLQVTHDAPKGSSDLVALAAPVETALLGVSGVRDVTTDIRLTPTNGESQINYQVMLKEGADATKTEALASTALKKIKNVGKLNLITNDSFTDGAGGGGITLQIRGNDASALKQASALLEKQLKDADGVQAVKSDLEGDQPVIRVRLNEAVAAKIGYDPTTVAQAVQAALEGQTVGKLMLGGADRSIVVRTPNSAKTAEQLGSLMLPVTAQQTAEARKIAADKLAADAEAKTQQAQAEAEAQMNKQIREASNQRGQLVAQMSELTAQLQQLQNLPIVPEQPVDPQTEAEIRAQQQRAEQIESLQSAIEGARSGIQGIDEQISALRTSQREAASSQAEAKQAEEQQKAALEVNGTSIPLNAIAEVKEELTAPTIQRADGERQVALTVTPKKGQLDKANAAVSNATATVDLPAGVSFDVSGVNAEKGEAFGQLGGAMLAAIVLVLLVMIATFRNFRGPFVLLVSIPFAATGALVGLLVTNTALGLPAMIGLLMLIGIVVTNAIVLMDLINRLRAAGASLEEAVEHGTRLRLRPILMTAAATIFALIPMSLGLTGGGMFISKPLAIVVIGGLVSSTLLTLILVPILYTFVERRYIRKGEKRAERKEGKQQKREAKLAGKRGELPQSPAEPDGFTELKLD